MLSKFELNLLKSIIPSKYKSLTGYNKTSDSVSLKYNFELLRKDSFNKLL